MKKNTLPEKNKQHSRSYHEIWGLFFLCLTVLSLLSIMSYDPRDPHINHVVRGNLDTYNFIGKIGANTSAVLVDFFGFGAFTPTILLGTVTVILLFKLPISSWLRCAMFVFFGLCLSVAGAAWNIGLGEVRGGGLVGQSLYNASVSYFSKVGSGVIWGFIFLLSVQSIGGFSWRQLGAGLLRRIRASFDDASERSRLAKDMARGGKNSSEPAPRGQEGPLNGEAGGKPLLVWPGSDIYSREEALTGKDGKAPYISIQTSNEPLPATDKKGLMGKLRGLFSVSAGPETPPWLDDLEHDRIGGAAVQAKAPLKAEPAPNPADPEAAKKPEKPSGGSLGGVIIDEQYQAPKAREPKPRRAPARLPSLDLLRPPQSSSKAVSRKELEDKGRTLMTCLNDFSIQAELVRITPGPVVTSFEIRPAPGVKSSRISGLSDDIALGLKAIAVRIQAPIPGTDTVGIEIPNTAREVVSLRELLAAKDFQSAESLLTMALGKDISGVPTNADLARMPHMLVAGATGTGKSVFLNSVLMSLLYKARPEEVKLLLVDPKRIELAVYADLPHLVHPIVTDMSLAKNALDWAVAEMERRYNDIARLGVRNVLAYNEKLKELGSARPQDLADLEPMPYLVLIIDELADLMLTAGKDVETSIVRLAQLARAAGIHLIIATQRPSVDVVTGLIKANFPCRISFQVTSKHDSRTILDTVGAEHLLGRGDMLFKPAGGRFQRLHGAFVSDEEVAAVADYWRKQQPPDYRVDFSDWGADGPDSSGPGGAPSFGGEDQKYAEAVEFVRQQGKASISLIQRRFRIGFNSAARIIEQMEKDGIIGPADGSKPRVVR